MRLAAGLRQQTMHLAAMMGLVIEHMGDQEPTRFGYVALDRTGVISVIGGKPCRVDVVGPMQDRRIEAVPLRFEVLPVGVERNRFRNAARRPRLAGEAAHPDAVGPEQMAQRLVDRAEEGAALLPPRLLRELVGDAIEVLVLPAIVPRHALDVGAVDHGTLTPRAPTSPGRQSPRRPPAR